MIGVIGLVSRRTVLLLTIASIMVGISSVAYGATLTGNDSANTINGTDSADRIDGRGGNDTLRGNGGNDTIIGGTGQDLMTGGAGADTFVVDNGACSGFQCKSDRISDYRKSQGDRIDAPGSGGRIGTHRTGGNTLVQFNVTSSSWRGQVLLLNVSLSASDVTVF
jgi:Ca2+-binding RTX toxin-like protein